MRVLIVDDEPLAREGLRALCGEHPAVTAVELARNGREAIAALRANPPPDLVFLDVQMPELDGLGVVEAVGADAMPPTAFVTAHDRFALRAFDLNAVDYLLKPVTRERFATALARLTARVAARDAGETQRQLLGLIESLAGPPRALRRLAVRDAGKTVFVELTDIDWIAAAENYVELHVGRACHLLQVTMATLERSLDAASFVRVHRSTIVQIARITALEATPGGEYLITLADGTTLRSGRTYADRLRTLATNPF